MSSARTPSLSVSTGDRFMLLDLMRGIAAIAVLIYHGDKYLGVQLLPNAYLAVDMFFLLSGFVIAHNYDRKIANGMTLRDFMAQRLIRLYPCFLLTFVLGFVLASARMIRDMGYIDGWRLFAAGTLNALFLPAVIRPYNLNDIFPFNGAGWSLTFELVANIIYWLLFRYLSALRLMLLIGAAVIAMATVVAFSGSIDVGMRPSDFWLGLPRVILPFFMGVALRRYVYGELSASISVQLKNWGVTLAVTLLLLSFSLARFFSSTTLSVAELVVVAVLFPLLLLAVSGVTPGPWLAKLCKLTGDASYPVYLLQTPFVMLFAAVPQLLFNVKAQAWVPMIGIAHISVTILCALWIDRYYEPPLRKMLKNYWLALTANKVVVATRNESA